MGPLERILAAKRDEVAALKASGNADMSEAGPVLPFADTLAAASRSGRCGIIAEFKRSSPSEGRIAAHASAAATARAYRDAGADCLSVLTDGFAFGGSVTDMARARTASAVPTLRKDFMIDAIQIGQARRAGADAILLILAILDDIQAAQMCAEAAQMGMDALIEVHTEDELERALALPSRLIGINNRNLADLSIDLATTERLAPRVPPDRIVVSESGIASPADILRLRTAGASAFLIGSHLMRSDDPAHALGQLVAAASAQAGKNTEHN